MQITIVVNSLQQGGAERAAVRLAESFVNDGHKVTIATWDNDRDFYTLDERITRINLGNFFHHKGFRLPIIGYRFGGLGKFFNLIKFRKQIQELKPDVVIAMEALVGSIMAISLAMSRIPVIVSERVNPDPYVYKPHVIARLLRPFIYKRLATCSVQTEGFANWVLENWKVSATVTPNLIPTSWITNSKSFDLNNMKIVSIGRVEPQKGFDILLSAWERLDLAKNDWRLEIIGSQNNSNYLSELLSLGDEKVCFSVPTHQVSELLDSSTIFISSSRFEGFPNVVLEALSRGVPTIAAISSDVVKIWAKAGALIAYEPEDVETLEKIMISLMGSPERREMLSKQAIAVAKNYTWEKVGQSWYWAIDQSIKQKS